MGEPVKEPEAEAVPEKESKPRRTRVPKSTAMPKKKTAPKKTGDEDSRTNRRIVTDTYKSQRIDCHLVDWIVACDPTHFPRDLYQNEKRSRVLSALAFATGWLPDDPKLSQLGEVHKYMQWQLDLYSKGKVKKSQVGGYAWKLPKRGPNGEPPALPEEVLAFHKHRKDHKARDGESEEDDNDEEEYVVETSKNGKIFLVEQESGRKLPLPALTKKAQDYFVYYSEETERWILGGGNPDDCEPEACETMFDRAFPKGKKKKTEKTEEAVKAKGKTESGDRGSHNIANKPRCPIPPGARTSSRAGTSRTGTTKAPSSSRAASAKSPVEESASDKAESEPDSDVGSLFEKTDEETEKVGDKEPEDEGQGPHIELLKPAAKDGEDKMALLTSPKDGMELLLPAGKEWKLSVVTIAGGTEETMLVCTSDPSIKKRYVHQAMKSSKAKPIGTALQEMESKMKIRALKEPEETNYIPSSRKTSKQPETPERSSRASTGLGSKPGSAKNTEDTLESELKDIEKASKVKGEPDKKRSKTGDGDSKEKVKEKSGDESGDKPKEKIGDGDSKEKLKEKSGEDSGDKAKEKTKGGDGHSKEKAKEKSGNGNDSMDES
eukprot:s1957_g12.t1